MPKKVKGGRVNYPRTEAEAEKGLPPPPQTKKPKLRKGSKRGR